MRWVKIGLLLCVFSYSTLVAAAYITQRYLVFATWDGGSLAAANWVAIENTTRFYIPTSDGEKLSAWYARPAPGKPVFLFFHGKGGGLERKKWRWRRITKRGAGILTISYRGYPGSTGSPSEIGLIRDALAAYNWLRKKHSTNQIILHGLSLGTGVAVALAERVQARALILEAPFTAVSDVASERYPFLPVHWLMHDQFLTRERIDKIGMPVLIAHGTADTVIPFQHAKRLFEIAKRPKELKLMQGSDHSTLVRDGLYPHIWRFISNYK